MRGEKSPLFSYINYFRYQTIMSIVASKSQRRLIYGFGVNDADYVIKPLINGKRKSCPYYKRWEALITRCYSKNSLERYPAYVGCSVSDEWKYFSNFRFWMEKQDWKGKQLDKDILYPGNKVYSPDKCIFVPSHINLLLTKCDKKRGKYPLGVYYCESSKGFHSSLCKDGKVLHLGYYNNPLDAHRKYQLEKFRYINQIANKQTDNRLKNALISISNGIMEDYENCIETINYH